MSAPVKSGTRHFDTIVIGAGISGLACAARIFQQRAKGSVVVLEARDRIGGRIGREYVNGNRLDTGANWIHGIGTEKEPNPLVQILPHKRYRQLSGAVTFKPPAEDTFESLEVNGEGKNGWQYVSGKSSSISSNVTDDLVIPSPHSGTLMRAVWTSIGELHEKATNATAAEAKNTTMLSAVGKCQAWRDSFDELPSEYHPALRGLPQFLEPMEAAPLAAQSAEHKEDIAGMSLLEFAIDDFDGDQVYIQDGYMAVVEEVAKDLVKSGAVELGVEVEQIRWDDAPMSIETTKGTFTADSIVCSLPLGVLKHRLHLTAPMDNKQPSLFNPSLPQDHIEAISSCGFGTLDKIFLVYSEPWWIQEPFASILKKGISQRPFSPDNTTPAKDSDEPDSFLGFTNELPGISIDRDGNAETGPRMLSIMNLHSLCGFPVLSAFVSCANAVYIESLSNAEAGALVSRSLTNWLGRAPPEPDAIHVTRWASDEYSRGSYSHMMTGVTEARHRGIFQHPVKNKHGRELRFAGEHTTRNHFATVHGALLSGWREADAILS